MARKKRKGYVKLVASTSINTKTGAVYNWVAKQHPTKRKRGPKRSR